MSGDEPIDDLACQRLVERITDYLEDVMPAAERARFDAHLAACDGCAVYLEQMTQTVRWTGMLRAADLPPETRASLLRLFRGLA